MIFFAIGCFGLSIGAITTVKEWQKGKTDRVKLKLKVHQIDKYNEWLESTNQHLIADEILNVAQQAMKHQDE